MFFFVLPPFLFSWLTGLNGWRNYEETNSETKHANNPGDQNYSVKYSVSHCWP